MIRKLFCSFRSPVFTPPPPPPPPPPSIPSPLAYECQFIFAFMPWCASSVCHGEYAQCFLDTQLQIHRNCFEEQWFHRVCIWTPNWDTRLDPKGEERTELQIRLERHAIAFILFLDKEGKWEKSDVNLVAVCITVAEITEEISFVFDTKQDIAWAVFMKCVEYVQFNSGFVKYFLRMRTG